MAGLIGEFECALDAKGRFLLPSSLKRQIDPAADDSFVINRGFEGCLVLYPKNEWEKITTKLKKLNLFVAKNRAFYRQFHNGATPVGLDGQGRINLPGTLTKFAEIEKKLVAFAYADRIELWSKDRYEAAMGTDDDFAALAEDVMGSLEDNDSKGST